MPFVADGLWSITVPPGLAIEYRKFEDWPDLYGFIIELTVIPGYRLANAELLV